MRHPFAHMRGQRDNAGVHRNTISNFETGKFVGSQDGLAATQRTFKSAGVIFVAESGEGPGVGLRKNTRLPAGRPKASEE